MDNTDSPAITHETLTGLFRRASHFMARVYHMQGHAHHAQAHVLGLLAAKSPMSQRDMLESLGVRSASLSELLAKLERAGLITRERDVQDKRSTVISITKAGTAAAAAHQNERRESATTLFASLTSAERQQLGELLIKIIVSLEEEFPDQASIRHHPGHGRCHGHMHGHGHAAHCQGHHGPEHGERRCGKGHGRRHAGRRGPLEGPVSEDEDKGN